MGDVRSRGAGGEAPPLVLLLDLKDEPEAIARYEAAHRPGGVPAAVLESIQAAGISEMIIHRAGNRLVMLVEMAPGAELGAKAAADAANPDVVAWEARMDMLQQRLPFAQASEKWVLAAPIFTLSEHARGRACA